MKNRPIRTMATLFAMCLASILPSAASADLERIDLPPDSAILCGDYYYTLADGQATIAQYAGELNYDEDGVTIPETLDGYPVTCVGEQSFAEVQVEGIVVPNGVTRIDKAAFYYCGFLSSLTLPESVVTIGEYAFGGCSKLTEIQLPEGITVIEDNTFNYCTGLTGITLPAGLVSIGACAFAYCYDLTDIAIPGGVTAIEGWTFYGCRGLTGITLPGGLRSIGRSAFENCRELKDVALPESVVSIEAEAFANCPNLTLTVARGSYAEDYAICNKIPYAYGDANVGFQKGTPIEGIEIQTGEMHETYETDGKLLATLDASFPEVSGMADRADMERINAAIRDFILTEGGYADTCKYALIDYLNSSEKLAITGYGLTANARAELLRGDTLLAVRYDFVLDSGGPHPWDTIAARYFDLSTGTPVTLETLTSDPEAVRERVIAETLSWIEVMGFDAFDDADVCAEDWTFANGLLTSEGLLVFYNEGVLGPVSEGAVEFLIPYERFQGLLDSIAENAGGATSPAEIP